MWVNQCTTEYKALYTSNCLLLKVSCFLWEMWSLIQIHDFPKAFWYDNSDRLTVYFSEIQLTEVKNKVSTGIRMEYSSISVQRNSQVRNIHQELTFNMNSYPIISNQTLTDFPAHKVSNLVNTYCMESLKGSVWLMLLWYQSKHIFRYLKKVCFRKRLFKTKTLKIIWLSNLSTLSVPRPNEGYSRNALCTLNLISMFLLQNREDMVQVGRHRLISI
jgi:hypothetical protein